MSKPTKEEMLEHLNDFMDCVHPFRLGGHCLECQAIRSLIENSDKGPAVTRGFVINSARAMGAAPDALAMVLEEAGVKIKEGK